MRKAFESVIADFRAGENIELYFAIILSAVVGVLGLLGTIDQKVVTAVLLAIIGTVLAGMIATKKSLIELSQTSGRLNSKVSSLNENLPNKELLESGVRGAHKYLPREYLDQKFRMARKEICVFITWLPGEDPLSPGLIESAKLGTPIKILLIDPNSKAALQRVVDMGFPPEPTKMTIALQTLRVVIQKGNLQNCKIEIRLFNALPAFSLYAADEWMLIGLYWHGLGNVKGSHLEVYGKNSPFGENIMNTFENIWEISTPVPLSLPSENEQAK